MLRALENEIISRTGASVVEVPAHNFIKTSYRTEHGMRLAPVRKYLPKKKLQIQSDVIWYILMGPENYELDVFRDWDLNAKHKIVYLFDTLEPQFGLMQKLFVDSAFNICITSFNDAVPYLESLTGKEWHAIEQAVPPHLFKPVPLEERVIDFSSYGRRMDGFHTYLMEFCKSNGLYYDYSMHNGRNLQSSNEEFYRQYAWHLNHSIFTISWPVGLTNPARAGRLNPITCRWFEAAAAGTVVVGQKPSNSVFDDWLYPDMVVTINPLADRNTIWTKLDRIYSEREKLFNTAKLYQQENEFRWTWAERVQRMVSFLNTHQSAEKNVVYNV